MPTKICIFLLLTFFASFSLFAQTTVEISPSEKWEYLIVSIGNFSDKEALKVPEKWIGRRQGTVGFFQDVQRQNEFDRLGKLGWELVEILPVSSNDQPVSDLSKFVFKRKSDPNRSLRESEELKNLLAEIKITPPNVVKTTDLIELDRANYEARQNEAADTARLKLEQAVKNVKGFSIVSVNSSAWFPNNNDRRVRAEVVIDASKDLLRNGNQYRASEADKFIRQAANEIYKAAQLKPQYVNQEPFATYSDANQRGVIVKIIVVVGYNGTTKTVSEGFVQGGWDETEKL